MAVFKSRPVFILLALLLYCLNLSIELTFLGVSFVKVLATRDPDRKMPLFLTGAGGVTLQLPYRTALGVGLPCDSMYTRAV